MNAASLSKKNKIMNNSALHFFRFCLLTGILICWRPGHPAAQTPCMTDAHVQRNFQRLPELPALRQLFQDSMKRAVVQTQPRTSVTIPVVVHVVYKSNLENIPDDQILSQLDVLNADYQLMNANAMATPALFVPLAADMELEFCLAGSDPNGNPTSGIVRRETSWNNIGQLIAPDDRPRIHYTELGGDDAWDPEHYLNIWVCSIGGGILGFGTYPGTAPPAEDGVVIDPRYFGTTGLAVFNAPHHLGRTATHEIGHYFNLFHIWGDDELSCNDDDEVTDTPTQRGPYLGCPAFPQFSCGNSAMFMNFMDYTNDACMTLFTEGQKARLWATLNTVRSGLLESNGCSTTAVQPVKVRMSSLRISPNPGWETVTIDVDFIASSGVIQIYDMAGKLRISAPIDTNAEQIQINIAALPAGVFQIQILSEMGSISGFFVKM